MAGWPSLRPEAIPEPFRQHLRGCPGCAGALRALRLERGLLSAASTEARPPADFVASVLAALPGRSPARAEADIWRPAWGLVPAFAAAAVVLLLLLQTAPTAAPSGLLPTEGLSTGEQILLGGSAPDLNQILTAILEPREP